MNARKIHIMLKVRYSSNGCGRISAPDASSAAEAASISCICFLMRCSRSRNWAFSSSNSLGTRESFEFRIIPASSQECISDNVEPFYPSSRLHVFANGRDHGVGIFERAAVACPRNTDYLRAPNRGGQTLGIFPRLRCVIFPRNDMRATANGTHLSPNIHAVHIPQHSPNQT